MGGSSSSSTEMSQTTYPKWQQDALAGTYTVGKGQLENFLRNPQYSVAGFTTDTLKGMDLARETAQQAYTAEPLRAPGSPNLQAAYGTAAQGTAAQVTPGQIQSFMSPYMSSVVDSTVNTMGRERDRSAAQIGARAAASGSFGGSREAIQRGQLDRNFGEQVGSVVSQLMAAGYDKATATALANTGFQQQTNMANTQNQQQTGLANQAAENTMRTAGADYGLKATQVDDALRTTNQARQMSALEQLLRQGSQQQGQNQEVLDVPWTALERLLGITPKQLNSQTFKQGETEKQESAASTFGSIASGLGSLGIKFSDARMKTNIRMLGSLPNGLGVYEYAWRSDGAREIGLIAQEVRRMNPGAVIEAPNGMLMVDYGKAVGSV